jgi:hypothetical protein
MPGVLSILGGIYKYYDWCLSMSMSTEFRKPARGDVSRSLELAERFLAEGRELIDKDPVQASEKLYKAAEEAVKALAKLFNLPQAGEAEKLGRWTAELLFKAVSALVKRFGEDVRNWWHTAWVLHVEGFHEARLDSDYVTSSYSHVESLVNFARKVLKEVQ